MIVCFLSNISAKYYKNPSMLSRIMAKNVGDVFLRHSVDCKIAITLCHMADQVVCCRLSCLLVSFLLHVNHIHSVSLHCAC